MFLDQGLNLCPLHWQADSVQWLLDSRESPKSEFLTILSRKVTQSVPPSDSVLWDLC